MSTKEMRSLLQRRKVNMAALVEKDEFMRAVGSSTPSLSPRLAIPAKWKASYAAEKIDSRRVTITWEEITSRSWRLVFIERSNFMEHGSPRMVGHFGKDYIWTSPFGEHPWHFSGENAVQVGQFPPVYAKRDNKTWEWILTNDRVRLEPVYS